MKGILLAGGLGTRLWPMTLATSKQLLPVYDKPAIYYPLSTLMDIGIQEILVISSPRDLPAIENLLGDGSSYGIEISYEIQVEPKGIAQALMIGKDFLAGDSCYLILGDNLFFGLDSSAIIDVSHAIGASVLSYKVPNPSEYGNLRMDSNGNVTELVEKPLVPISPYAVTGLYFFDSNASEYVNQIKLSKRGEFEIIDLLNIYLAEGSLSAKIIPDGAVWMDMGTIPTINAASEYVRLIQDRQGILAGSPHLIAVQKGWIERVKLLESISAISSQYAFSLRAALTNNLH